MIASVAVNASGMCPALRAINGMSFLARKILGEFRALGLDPPLANDGS